MLQPIKVSIKCMLSAAFQFNIFPEMETSELSQFILSCQLLHETDDDDDDRYPYRLISNNFNPIIDFMLVNPGFTIGQIYDVFKYNKAKEELSLACLKQSDFEKYGDYNKTMFLPIAVYYQPKTILKELQTAQRFVYSFQLMKKEEQQQKYERKSSDWFTFSQQVHLDGSSSSFLVYRYMMKSQLSNFQKVQNAFVIRKRLIELHNEHLHLFGQLKQIREEQDRVSFVFLYVPCVSFSDIMHFEFSNTAISYLVNKIWMFVLTLVQNNFQRYIYGLYKRRALRSLFDSIVLCFNHRLILTDLNILLQRGEGQQRFTHADHEKMIDEINIYVKLNKSQLIKYDDIIQVYESSNNQPISCFTFCKIYNSNTFHFFSASNSQYQPKTNALIWKPQLLTPQNERKVNMNEATTVKKPKIPAKNMQKMTKKEQNKSLNRSRAHESVKKTKYRRNY